MTKDPWISRKEIAIATGLSVDTIRRSETHLGLDKIKVTINPRYVVYRRLAAIAILDARKLLSLQKLP